LYKLTVKNEGEDNLLGVVAGLVGSVILEEVSGALGEVNTLNLLVHSNTVSVHKEYTGDHGEGLVVVVVRVGSGERAGLGGTGASGALLSPVLAGHNSGARGLLKTLVMGADNGSLKFVAVGYTSKIKGDLGGRYSGNGGGKNSGKLHRNYATQARSAFRVQVGG
jgi:hypothetical protein